MKGKTLQSPLLDNLFIFSEEKSVPFKVKDFSAHNAYEIYLLLEGERRIFIGMGYMKPTVGMQPLLRRMSAIKVRETPPIGASASNLRTSI